MKTTVYRYSSAGVDRTAGMHPGYGLRDTAPALDPLEFCDPVEIELPGGYGVVECHDGAERIEDPEGRVCELVANGDSGFWVMPMTGGASGLGLYVRIDGPEWDGEGFGYVATVKGGRS